MAGPWRAVAAAVVASEQRAHEDALTGLPNRRAIEVCLTATIAGARRHRRLVGLLLADVDNFKRVNDAWGHQGGDESLREIGRRLRRAVRAEDLVGRWGGEEFVVVVDSPSGTDGLATFAEQVRRTVAGPQTLPGGAVLAVTVSVGGALYPAHAAEERSLVAAADAALYRAKRGGRDRVELIDGTATP